MVIALHNWEAFPCVQLKLLMVCLLCSPLLSTLWDRESSAAFLENPSDAPRKYFEFQFNSNRQLQIGTCRLPLQGLNHAAADFQHLLKGVQGGEQKWGALWSGKNWQDRSSDRCFQELIVWVQFLFLFISRKALKSFTVTTLLVPSKSVMRLIETSGKISAWWHVLPLHQSHMTFPPASLEQFLRATWDAVSQAAVLIWPQIKFNSQLTCCAIF